ncbi:MAG: hypothetical protein HY718_20800 [Planctomycetes bacterium]|nr:hypothetical protein [Planctomycetota bacterium]
MGRASGRAIWLLSLLVVAGCLQGEHRGGRSAPARQAKLTARTYNSGFPQAHDTFNGLSAASDGRIYYVLSSTAVDVGAQMYVFDPDSGQIKHLGDLTEACGEKGLKTIVQGKSHAKFVERDGKLYFATHVGYYAHVGGVEKMGVPPEGYKPYPGGHFLAYNMAAGRFEDFGIGRQGEGIVTMSMDARRGRLYALTWPTGHFVRYDLAKREMRDLGPYFEEGEAGEGSTYRKICRSIAVDPNDGSAYFTNPAGDILRYRHDRDAIEPVAGESMEKDYFGQYDPASTVYLAYNWRQVVWRPAEQVFYGVHPSSGYLFRFDPRAVRVEVLERLTSEPSKRSGMFDQFRYGYLGFELGPDGRTLYYLTGGPIAGDGRDAAVNHSDAVNAGKKSEDFRLITYDIPTGRYRDHGAIYFANGDRPAAVQSIAVGKDGTVYALSKITENGSSRTDLISIAPVSPCGG